MLGRDVEGIRVELLRNLSSGDDCGLGGGSNGLSRRRGTIRVKGVGKWAERKGEKKQARVGWFTGEKGTGPDRTSLANSKRGM